MTSYQVSVLYDANIGNECSNNHAQLNKCGLQECAKYAFIKLQYQHGIQ